MPRQAIVALPALDRHRETLTEEPASARGSPPWLPTILPFPDSSHKMLPPQPPMRPVSQKASAAQTHEWLPGRCIFRVFAASARAAAWRPACLCCRWAGEMGWGEGVRGRDVPGHTAALASQGDQRDPVRTLPRLTCWVLPVPCTGMGPGHAASRATRHVVEQAVAGGDALRFSCTSQPMRATGIHRDTACARVWLAQGWRRDADPQPPRMTSSSIRKLRPMISAALGKPGPRRGSETGAESSFLPVVHRWVQQQCRLSLAAWIVPAALTGCSQVYRSKGCRLHGGLHQAARVFGVDRFGDVVQARWQQFQDQGRSASGWCQVGRRS